MFIITIAVHYDPPLQYHVDQQQLQQAQSQARAPPPPRAPRTYKRARKRTPDARTHAQTTPARPRRLPARVCMECTHAGWGCVRLQSSAASVISEEAWHAVDSLALAQAVLR